MRALTFPQWALFLLFRLLVCYLYVKPFIKPSPLAFAGGWANGAGAGAVSLGFIFVSSSYLLRLFRERKCSGTGNWKVSIIYHLGKIFRWVRLLLFHLFHLASSE